MGVPDKESGVNAPPPARRKLIDTDMVFYFGVGTLFRLGVNVLYTFEQAFVKQKRVRLFFSS